MAATSPDLGGGKSRSIIVKSMRDMVVKDKLCGERKDAWCVLIIAIGSWGVPSDYGWRGCARHHLQCTSRERRFKLGKVHLPELCDEPRI